VPCHCTRGAFSGVSGGSVVVVGLSVVSVADGADGADPTAGPLDTAPSGSVAAESPGSVTVPALSGTSSAPESSTTGPTAVVEVVVAASSWSGADEPPPHAVSTNAHAAGHVRPGLKQTSPSRAHPYVEVFDSGHASQLPLETVQFGGDTRQPNQPATSTMMWASENVQILIRPSTETPVTTTFGTVWLAT
jgi:hypothetical protein